MSLTVVCVPDVGDFTDVPVIEIHVAPGDTVAVEDPLVTLESDKATMDVPAPVAGVVKEVQVAIGDRVSEGSVLLTMDVAAANSAASSAPSSAPSAAPAALEADVLVIGAGPGGYTAAFRAADLGLKTILVEREETLGGVCLNVGCIPSKTLLHAARVVADAQDMSERGLTFGPVQVDIERLRAWKESVVGGLAGGLGGLARRRGVEVVHGTARFTGPHTVAVAERTIRFANCVIAAGSRPASLPFLPDDPRIMDSTGALALADVPGRLLVIGGGVIGLEMATVYDALGSRVTVVELSSDLLPGWDEDLVAPLAQRLAGRYEAVRLGTGVASVRPRPDGLEVVFAGESEPQLFDRILVAVGRTPNGDRLDAAAAGIEVDAAGFIPVDTQQRTSVPHIHAIGDVAGGPMLAHKAAHEGRVAAEVIAGHEVAFDPQSIPSVAYTDPEVAWTGLSETVARECGITYEKAVFPWAASGRALSLGRPEGLTKVLTEPDTRRLLGVGIVGAGAGELIAEAVHALEVGSDAEDLALTIHPHPTLSETLGLAAEAATGTITDLYLPGRGRPSPAGRL